MLAPATTPVPPSDSLPAAPPGRAPEPSPRSRLWQIDAVRGLMLVLMTLTHVPTRFSSPAGQPFGYVSAAEGFVLLSAFMAGWVYTVRQKKHGVPEMRTAFLKRVVKIYLSQAALLIFLFSAVAVIGLIVQQSAVTNLVSFYLGHPLAAIAGALLLVYNPPLLDILPMYILFMLASSLVLVRGQRHGWTAMLSISVGLWFGTQFALGRVLYDAVVATTGFVIPRAETGAFDILAWQMVWMFGLWLGASYAAGQRLAESFPPWLVGAAAACASVGFVWRHLLGQAAFPHNDTLNLLFDKWQLGPLRVLNLIALLVVAVRFEPWLTRHLPRLRPLEAMGAASLPVFCAHLVVALLALALLGEPTPERPWAVDIAVLAACFAVLYATALASQRIDQRAARVRAAFAAARAERTESRRLSADARRSSLSRSRNRPR